MYYAIIIVSDMILQCTNTSQPDQCYPWCGEPPRREPSRYVGVWSRGVLSYHIVCGSIKKTNYDMELFEIGV